MITKKNDAGYSQLGRALSIPLIVSVFILLSFSGAEAKDDNVIRQQAAQEQITRRGPYSEAEAGDTTITATVQFRRRDGSTGSKVASIISRVSDNIAEKSTLKDTTANLSVGFIQRDGTTAIKVIPVTYFVHSAR